MSDERSVQKPSSSTSSTRSCFFLDTPEGQEHLARLIRHHRRDFLLADLSRQAAMIRFIRQELTSQHHHAAGAGEKTIFARNSRGEPLDEDAIALGIAKVFYLYTDEEEEEEEGIQQQQHDAKEEKEENEATGARGEDAEEPTRPAAAAARHSTTTTTRDARAEEGEQQDTTTPFDGEDCRLYEYLTSMRQNNNDQPPPPPQHVDTYRITPSPSHSPKFGPPGGRSSSSPPRRRRSAAAKRKATVDTAGGEADDDDAKRHGANDGPRDTQAPPVWSSGRGIPTRGEVHARAAALLSQTDATTTDIPRGVTARPSGRWQSQVYYRGSSRYLGVFSDAREAALVWTIAKRILTEVPLRASSCTKSDVDRWFATVRDVVTDLVQGAIASAPPGPAPVAR